MSDDLIDMVCRALGRAWGLGQTYWQQADSESYSQNRKSEETQRKFDALLEETRSALSLPAPPAEQKGGREPVTTYARQHAAHEAELTAMIAERDHREEIIDQLCDAVLGQDRTEWSSNYYFEDAVAEVQERILELEERKACRDSNSPVLPSSALAALRAKVEALPPYVTNYYGKQEAMLLRSQVLAEIDKLGGGV